jgi:hypothetical protein
MNQISLISPVPDGEAARSVSPGTHADLAQRIMATPAETGVTPARWGQQGTVRRRLLTGIPVAACLAVAVLIATSLTGPDQRVEPISVGPAKADALSFIKHSGYLDVIVRNPVADAKIYRAEFAAHHLNITLFFVPVSPSLVGTLVYAGGSGRQITTITAKGRCWTGGGGDQCPVGIRIPDGYHGHAQFAFGRAARPGERYESTGRVTAPGEAMHGLNYRGMTVSKVLAMLLARHVTVARFRYLTASQDPCGKLPAHIPGDWRVNGADPWAPGQVLLWVGPAHTDGGSHCAAAQQPMPKASPTAVSPSPAS